MAWQSCGSSKFPQASIENNFGCQRRPDLPGKRVFIVRAWNSKKEHLASYSCSIAQLERGSDHIFPVIPKKLKRKLVGSTAVGVGGGNDEESVSGGSGSDSDVDASAHDFTAEGLLPEALTSVHMVKTPHERAAQLAADCHEVRSTIGMADIGVRYPRNLHFLHVADQGGDRSTTEAMLLIPTGDGDGVNMTSFGESVALRTGSYTDVPVPTEWINVSRKLATQAKRIMAEQGSMDMTTRSVVGDSGVRFATNKITRAQLGGGLHDMWIRDFIKTCGTKSLYLCDFSHGGGEIVRSAVNAKVSEEATSSGVRVCVWAQDPRKIFAEIGRAVGRSQLSKLYVDGKLVVPGHQPCPNPGPRPERTRKLVKAMLPEPLKVLSLDPEGHLLIPTADEISKSCPVALSGDQVDEFAAWRLEFPRPEPTANNSQENKEQEGVDQPAVGGAAPKPTNPESKLRPGTTAGSIQDLSKYGDKIQTERPLPEGAAASCAHLKLVHTQVDAAVGANKINRVWIRNEMNKHINVAAGTIVGKGGTGTFVSLVSTALPDDKLQYCWRYTRFAAYKKDNAELANGYMVFNKTGQSLTGKPKFMLLAEIEADIGNNVTVYGHAITRGGTKVTITPSPSPVVWAPSAPAVGGADSQTPAFSTDALGQYLKSYEDVSGVPKCTGLVRPVFEMKPVQQAQMESSSGSGYVLQPGAPPGHSALWLATSKKFEVPANGFVLLG